MSVSNSFSSGTTISSSEMNANFTDFASEVTNSLPRDGQAAMTGQLKITAGTAAAPGLIFSTDTNTGIYRAAADELGVAVGGASAGKFTSAGFVGAATTAAGESYDAFPAGTVMLFYQLNAPTGWTAQDALSDYAVRVVAQNSGIGGTTGGTTNFAGVFAARTITQANLPNVNLTAASNGDHRHFIFSDNAGTGTLDATDYPNKTANTGGDAGYGITGNASIDSTLGYTSETGAHTHTVPLGGSGTAMDFDVAYLNIIVATKD